MNNKKWATNIAQASEYANIANSHQLWKALVNSGLDVSRRTVWQWYTGHHRPTRTKYYQALNKVLKISDSDNLFRLLD